MRWTERLMVLLTIVSLLAGCRPVKPVSHTARSGDGILTEMWGSKDCVVAGETVHLRATATNRGTEPFAVDLHDQPVLDIWVSGLVEGKGAILQRWSEGKPLTPDVTGLALNPGQSKTLEMDWIPAAAVSGPAHAVARYIRRHSWGDDPLVLPITIEVQACRGPLP